MTPRPSPPGTGLLAPGAAAPALEVLDPGLATTLQDGGRDGGSRAGVPPSGALDRDALRLANALTSGLEASGSRERRALERGALEIRFLGPKLRVAAPLVRVAAVGAPLTVTRGDETFAPPPGRSVTLGEGDSLRVGATEGGGVAYLAVAGGFAVAPLLGSQATYARGGFGGFAGRAISAGDRLALAAPEPLGPDLQAPPDCAATLADLSAPPGETRVVLGPQADYFSDAVIAALLAAPWTISKDADRMGLRLEGPTLQAAKGHDIVSDGVVTGALQVPASGQPILLGPDRQTSGGYPKIACVISADLPAIGRARPGDRLAFEAIAPAAAAQVFRAREATFAALLDRLAPVAAEARLDVAALYTENLISAWRGD